MTEPRRFPFGGIPVYNPQSLSKTEALAQFHVRQAAYESLLSLLRESRPSHVLIIGTRGMGKTTLLQRVRYGVEDDADLSGRYLALVFPEEQYNVNRLDQFLLNTVDALADATEHLKSEGLLARVEAYAGTIGKCKAEEIEEQVPRFLAEISRQLQRSLLLLVDNADRLFETLEKRQQWRLRELLSSQRDLTFFGATAQASEAVYGPDNAFFEFFKIHRLVPLTFTEVRDLLLRLSESIEEPENAKGAARRRVSEWLDADAARLRTLVQLTGGNPRTTVLLFHLVLDGLNGSAREYLEQLLDQVTPNYKGRVDELPAQAQQVLDAVALRWDPVTAMEVAEDTRLETSAVSTHLTRLVRQGILEKAAPGDSKKALYQVAERFFNIWYLMRASRRVRAKLRWFVEFLRVFFDSGELEQMAWERIKLHQSTWRGHPEEVETAFAYVIASRARFDQFENYLRQKYADIEEVWRPYLDVIEHPNADGKHSGARLQEARLTAGRSGHVGTETEAEIREALQREPRNPALWCNLGIVLAQKHESAESEEAYWKAIGLDPTSAWTWRCFGDLLAEVPQRTSEAETAYRKSVELDPAVAWTWECLGDLLAGVAERVEEAETAYRKALQADPNFVWGWTTLGDLLAKIPERREEAEAAYRKALEVDPTFVWAWRSLGDLLADVPGRCEEAEAAYRKALEVDSTFVWAWWDLGGLLAEIPGRAEEAEAAYRKAVEIDPTFVWAWRSLGHLLAETPGRAGEAEAAARKAVEIDPTFVWAWCDLGNLLVEVPDRTEEAEAAYRKATEVDPNCVWAWSGLGYLLAELADRAEDAEAAYRHATEVDPKFVWAWRGLGNLLARVPERAEDAEQAYRKAIELDPTLAASWGGLASVLAKFPQRTGAAEAAYRKAVELAPQSALAWRNLGGFLACRAGRAEDAAVAFRKSLQLRPSDFQGNGSLGVLLYCELGQPKEALDHLLRAHQIEPANSISLAILASCGRNTDTRQEGVRPSIDAGRRSGFWNDLLDSCQSYAPFGKILLGICELVEEEDKDNRFVGLYRAVALAQLRDFPRASVALEDAMTGDPIELLSIGQRALETFLAAAVKSGRVRECIELIEKKDWKDAWRPIYEALRAVEAGSAEYLKRVAVEIREPALLIARRIAPQLPDLAGRT